MIITQMDTGVTDRLGVQTQQKYLNYSPCPMDFVDCTSAIDTGSFAVLHRLVLPTHGKAVLSLLLFIRQEVGSWLTTWGVR